VHQAHAQRLASVYIEIRRQTHPVIAQTHLDGFPQLADGDVYFSEASARESVFNRNDILPDASVGVS
jgi:hypothetical protein